jgi:hypothetical protein
MAIYTRILGGKKGNYFTRPAFWTKILHRQDRWNKRGDVRIT